MNGFVQGRHPELDDFVDGRLGPDDATAIELHLEACAACRKRVEKLRRLDAALRSLPREIPPRRDLRPRHGRGSARETPGLRYVRIAAALALVIGAATFATWWGSENPAQDGVPRREGPVSVAGNQLAAELEAHRGSYEPATLRLIERNLRSIEAAIRQLEAARGETPETPLLDELLEQGHRTRLALLRDALSWPETP